jgi:Na+/H+ antiporter NhaC
MKAIRSLLLFLIGAAIVSMALMGYKYGGGTLFPNWDAVRLCRLTLFLSLSAVAVALLSKGLQYVQKRRAKRDLK